MAFDGIVIANIVSELNDTLLDGRISKIAQPEKDELLLTIKAAERKQHRLLISAGASLPLIYLAGEAKTSPMTAPNFCMLLRKHLNSAKILSITQPGLERVIQFKIQHLNELGDLCIKYLNVEIMGKHSNIIFCTQDGKIIDSIKHISSLVSSVREVLPGRDYFIPMTQNKKDPFTLSFDEFQCEILRKPMEIGKALYSGITGLSPLIAGELCHRSSIDSDRHTSSLDENEILHLFKNLERLMDEIKEKHFHPAIVFQHGIPLEFSSVPLTCYGDYSSSSDGKEPVYESREYDSISRLLEDYYAVKNTVTRIRQKSVDLRKVVSNALDKSRRKYDLQKKQLKDTEKRDKFKIYGELINTYGYELSDGAKSLTCLNYYTNEEITIPLDNTLSPSENSKKFFDKYNKLKRTFEAVSRQLTETEEEIRHLESISASLDIARKEEDLVQLKEELVEYGYMKRRSTKGKKAPKSPVSKPLHYISSDGYHMYVGKNNFQNDELTFKLAEGNDWWFHAKGIAGSHVIVKSGGQELPDRVFSEAGSLAAYYSKGRDSDKVEIDYIEKKHVKKPSGGKPGFVVYYTNYSLIAVPDISALTLIG